MTNVVIVCFSTYEKLIGDVEQLETGDFYIKNPYTIHSNEDYRESTNSTVDSIKKQVDLFNVIHDIKERSRIYFTETHFCKFMSESIDDGFIIPLDKVLTMGEPRPEIKEKYQELIEL